MLPTFVVIGAMKCGTTSLYAYLAQHPEIYMCKPKEPQFFTTRWERGLPWYEGLFAPAGDARARGEASTSCTDFPRKPHAAARMAAVIPDARLVYVVRDPVDRMRSHYRHRVADRIESRPIEEALRDARYLDRSRYAMQLEQYLPYYDLDRVLVLTAEELQRAPEAVLPRLHAFLDVAPLPLTAAPRRANEGTSRLQLHPRARRMRQSMKRSGMYGVVPPSLRRSLRRWGSRTPTANDHGEVTPDLRARIMGELADDLARLRELTGIDLTAARPAPRPAAPAPSGQAGTAH